MVRHTRKSRGIFSTLGNLATNAVNTVSKVTQNTLNTLINVPVGLVSGSKNVVRNSLKRFTNGTSRVIHNASNGANSIIRRVATRKNRKNRRNSRR